MNVLRFKKLRIFLMLILFSVSYSSFADDDLPPTDDPEIPSAPIDSGGVFLIVAGSVLACKVLHDNSQKRRLFNSLKTDKKNE